jgi:nicotinate phosphoribosyltransferase
MSVNHRLGPLFTDLYELTMAAGYFARSLNPPTTFSLFVRGYPRGRNYYVAAGLEDSLDELAALRFSAGEITYLKETGLFSDEFLAYLRAFRFTGSVLALPEGTIFFADEPVLEVTAPLIEAQIVETFLLNTIGFQSLIASKAARCVHAAAGRPLIDFSLRRTQGHDAGMKVARSAYIAGFAATSNVLAGRTYGIPTSGTMAHSYVQAFENEVDAFRAYASTFPHDAVFLIDTYDTLDGARHTAEVAREMKRSGLAPQGVRLDSGDMVTLSRQVRRILDDAGFAEIRIFASSGFDEYRIAEVVSAGAPIDAFGVGTKLGVSADSPYLDVVYKMVRCGGRDVRKYSPEKVTLAGEKQVFRFFDETGRFREDAIGVRDEDPEGAAALMVPAMVDGDILRPHPTLERIRRRFSAGFQNLPEAIKPLGGDGRYPVSISRRLQDLQKGSAPAPRG